MRRHLLVGVTLLSVVVGLSNTSSAEEHWKIGVAKRKITPEVPVFLSGYASRDKPFEEVFQDIYVKAMSFESADGHIGILVTSDLIGFRSGVGEAICEKIQSKTDLDRSQILLSSSHTHTGPTIFLSLDDRSEQMTLEQAQQTVDYSRQLVDLTVEVVLEALENRQPAKLSYGIGVCRFAMNRREWTPKGIVLGFNPAGYVDRSVPILRVDDAQGKLQAVVFGAGAHNTTLTGQHFAISGDYAGFAQHVFEEHHPDVQAMFVLGCAGSANPFPRGTVEDVEQHGRELATEVDRVLNESLSPIEGPLTTLYTTVDLPLQEPLSREEINELLQGGGSSWRRFVAKKMVEIIESGEELPRSFPFPLAVWQFGDDLTLIGLSGEVVNEYVPLLHNVLGRGGIWIAAYTNHVFGYLPTAQVLKEGGYETRGLYTQIVGLFAPEAEQVLVKAVRDLAKQAGRTLPEEASPTGE